MKKTPWFPPEIKPVRIGMYQCKACSEFYSNKTLHFHYWNGRYWSMDRNDMSDGFIPNSVIWRGLSERPK